jgi:hypothetical protein
MSATDRNDGAFRFYILEKWCDHKERMLALSLYASYACTQSCEINVFKKVFVTFPISWTQKKGLTGGGGRMGPATT